MDAPCTPGIPIRSRRSEATPWSCARTSSRAAPGEVVFRVRGATVVYDVAKEELVVDGHKAPAPLREGRQAITVYADRTGLEVFASGGLTYVPKPFQARAEDQSVEVDVKGGSAVFRTLRAYPLRSIWKGSR